MGAKQLRDKRGRYLVRGVRAQILKPRRLVTTVDEEIHERIVISEDKTRNDRSGGIVLVEDSEYLVLAGRFCCMIPAWTEVC